MLKMVNMKMPTPTGALCHVDLLSERLDDDINIYL